MDIIRMSKTWVWYGFCMDMDMDMTWICIWSGHVYEMDMIWIWYGYYMNLVIIWRWYGHDMGMYMGMQWIWIWYGYLVPKASNFPFPASRFPKPAEKHFEYEINRENDGSDTQSHSPAKKPNKPKLPISVLGSFCLPHCPLWAEFHPILRALASSDRFRTPPRTIKPQVKGVYRVYIGYIRLFRGVYVVYILEYMYNGCT